MLPMQRIVWFALSFACAGCGSETLATKGADAAARDVADAAIDAATGIVLDAALQVDQETGAADAGTDSGPFTVADVPGLALWLDASKGVTQDGNGKVSAWADQSINQNTATQATLAVRPTLVAQSINAKPAIHFAGSKEFLEIADHASLQAGTGDFYVAAVVKAANTVDYGFVYAKTDNSKFPFPGIVMSVNYPQTGLVGGQTEVAVIASTTTGMLNDNVARQFGFMRKAGTLGFRLNGAMQGTKANVVTDVSAPNQKAYIGCQPNGLDPLDGDIAELIVVKGAVSIPDLGAVESYLNTKYGL
jgi:hypothetical protein